MLKLLRRFFVFTCFLGGIHAQSMGLEGEITREYATFRGRQIPNLSNQPCLAVQFIYHLQESRAARAAEKIALIIGSGAGVGGISDRAATPAERALMVRGLNFAVRNNAVNSLKLNGGAEHVRKHQTVVAQIIESYQRIQPSWLIDSGINNMYYGAFPKTPVLHPYNPSPGANRGMFPLTPKLKTGLSRPLLPVALQQQIAGINDKDLDIFFVPQPYIKENDINGELFDGALLFRPQYWLDPDAPLQASGYNKGFDPHISFWQTPTGITINRDSGVFHDGGFSTHSGDENMLVSSEANCSIEDLIAGKREKSLAFWSLTSYAGRNALTLH
ncbi:hypothetical protein [Candidatus Finniella inopinata]|uniref:Uncharacterized protein n=1 Tax=Candidatus Finniella inopinata TaxID=1696036 RepID=A0A4Q7DI69_9PROT|nr:hypothetical protein [Candidatus Finniella inopinata]RZI45869.1 hypothetical protein EQU50_05405 [Candidatus Finniella inopinata]